MGYEEGAFSWASTGQTWSSSKHVCLPSFAMSSCNNSRLCVCGTSQINTTQIMFMASKNADDYTRSKPCCGAASVAPLLPKGKVKEGACVLLLQLAARIAVSNLHKNAKKSFSETIKDMYLHYNERSGLLLCGFQT
ncbi:hypothetical protein ACQJBY_059460 [Aegilops geniculata]